MIFGVEIPPAILVLGVLIGMTNGLLAVGLVLVYRSNRVINFAHGEIGAFAGAVFGLITVRYGAHYYLALPAALAIGAAIGAVTEVAVIRRLRSAPRVMSIVATLGVGQFLVAAAGAINAGASAGSQYPQPPGMPIIQMGAFRITQAYSGMLVFSPLVVVGIVWFLRRTRYGLAIRSAASNVDAARTAGISTSRMSGLTWSLAGGLSAFTAILVLPSQGFVSGSSFGPGLLLRALVGAVLARMQSLPIAMGAGIAVGLVEQVMFYNNPQSGLIEMILFGVILVSLLLQRRIGGREDEKGSWTAVTGWQPLPDAIRTLPQVAWLRRLPAALGVALLVLIPLVSTNRTALVFTTIFALAVVGLSVGVVTGLNGQLSLGQFALAAVGAVVSAKVSLATGNFLLAFLLAGMSGAAASFVIGLPALRIRGLLLAVTTLSFALATPSYLLELPWMLGTGMRPGRPVIGSIALETGRSYYWLAAAVLLVMLWLARNVWRSGIGRRFVAVRDNEDNARAFTVQASLVKVQAFAISGFFAGIGGAVFAHEVSQITAGSFPVGLSLTIVVFAVIGGLGQMTGPLIGAVFVIGLSEFVPLDAAGTATSNFGLLLILLYRPAGLGQMVQPLRDRVATALARRAGVDTEAAWARSAVTDDQAAITTTLSLSPSEPAGTRVAPGDVLLQGAGIEKHFGGVRAVDGVDLTVRQGEIVGLIGPNGAGKTTLFEVLGGFTAPEAGSVHLAGHDITRDSPERRARRGLIRSFQDAALFPTMTVLECVQLALEKVHPTRVLPALLGRRSVDRRRADAATELVAMFGLQRYRDRQVRELSTGTRRIVEICCLIALEPALLLLDEPSSGIAQRETEALGTLLRHVRDQLDTTMVVIEHDIPLIMGLADRIVAMDTGRVIAVGPPQQVRAHPQVVAAYLGGSDVAIDRSGTRRSGAPDVSESAAVSGPGSP